MSIRATKSIFGFLLIISVLVQPGCDSQTNVMVRSWAQDDYRSDVAELGTPEEEYYILMRGDFERGTYNDKTMGSEIESWKKVIPLLREALAVQNYHLVGGDRTIRDVDLLIVVHWGQTYIDTETIYLEFPQEDGYVEIVEFEQITDYSLRKNSLILGTADKIISGSQSFIKTYDEERAVTDTSTNRYYFALVAYDMQALLEREKIVQWVTQFSVPTSRKNYDEALPSLMRVASNFFGINSDDLSHVWTELGEGEVVIGEIEVIGEEKD